MTGGTPGNAAPVGRVVHTFRALDFAANWSYTVQPARCPRFYSTLTLRRRRIVLVVLGLPFGRFRTARRLAGFLA